MRTFEGLMASLLKLFVENGWFSRVRIFRTSDILIHTISLCFLLKSGFEIRRFRKKLKVKKTQARGKKLKLKPIFEKTQVIF